MQNQNVYNIPLLKTYSGIHYYVDYNPHCEHFGHLKYRSQYKAISMYVSYQ